MDGVFPFGCPAPTLLYLGLYVVTLAAHVVFMNYVFAGSAYLAIQSLRPGGPEGDEQTESAASVLRDWLPFAFSGLITAGIAPLLFIQILYKAQFYTANLLSFYRWLAILPTLVAAFYVMYLLKSRAIGDWPAVSRVVVTVGAFLAVSFVGYSWAENHLLSMDRQTWVSFYGEGRLFYWRPVLLPRLAMWLAGSFPTMMTLVCWQLLFAQRRGLKVSPSEIRGAARWAGAGLVASVLFAGVCYLMSEASVRQEASRLGAPYAVIAMVGVLLQAGAWFKQWRGARLSRRWLAMASGGAVLTIVGVCVARESLRFASIDVTALYARHAAAYDNAGRFVFLLFFAVNAALIAWCVLAVRRALKLDKVESTPPR